MGVHIHVQLPQHHSGARLNGKNTTMLGVVGGVMGEDIPHGAVDDGNTGDVAGR